MELTRTESGRLTDAKGRPLPFEVTLTASVGAGVPVRIREVTLRPSDSNGGITRAAVKALEAGLDDFGDYVAARAIAHWHVENRTHPDVLATSIATFDFVDGDDGKSGVRTLVVGPALVEHLQEEVRRRRRTGGQDRYELVAQEYAKAQARGLPVRDAIRAVFQVSPSHADNLIREARRRGLLPPARKGRTQAAVKPTNRNTPRKSVSKERKTDER